MELSQAAATQALPQIAVILGGIKLMTSDMGVGVLNVGLRSNTLSLGSAAVQV